MSNAMLDEAHEGLHLQEYTGAPTWQENMFFSGYDFYGDAGFAIHLKLRPGAGVTAVRAQVMLGRESVGVGSQHHLRSDLVYPDFAFDAREPFRSHRLQLRGRGRPTASTAGFYGLTHEDPPQLDVGIDLELTTPLVAIDWVSMLADTPVGGTGDGHFDQGFAFAGDLRIGDRRVRVDGRGWRDHSWGDRNLSSIRVMFVFVTADDLSRQLSAVRVNLPDGDTTGFTFLADHDRVQLLGKPETTVLEGVEEPGRFLTVETRVDDIFVTSRVRAHGNLLLLPDGYRAGQGHAKAEIRGRGTGYSYLEAGAATSPAEAKAIITAADAVLPRDDRFSEG